MLMFLYNINVHNHLKHLANFSYFMLFEFSLQCFVLLCVLKFWVPCCDVRYDFRIKTMFGSSLPLLLFVWGLMLYLRYLCLDAYSGFQHYCVVFLFCLPSSCVLCTLCCQFLWIVHFLLPFQYSLTFICRSLIVRVPYFASFSGLSMLFAPSVFSNVYL